MTLKSRFNMGCACKNEVKKIQISTIALRQAVVKRTVSEYVQKSSIQGVAYVGDDKLNKIERFWWFVMFVGLVVGASYLIYQAYRTMKENPIIENPSLTRTPMWEVPFPAVTFCIGAGYDPISFTLNKTNLPDLVHTFPPDKFIELTNTNGAPVILETLLLRTSNQSNYDILTQVLPDIVHHYAYFGSMYADGFFQKTITSFGTCATFNMYPEKDLLRDGVALSSVSGASDDQFGSQLWSRDSGFRDNLPLTAYVHPLRSYRTTNDLRLSFAVNDSARFCYFPKFIYVSIHAPDEVPQFTADSDIMVIEHGKSSSIEITPHLVVSEGIEHYEPEVRQCYYSDERRLQFYKNYTQNHCDEECAANHTLTQCGCVPYHMPHFNDTKLCATYSEFECFRVETEQFYLPNFIDGDGRAPIDACKCLPSCTQLSYKVVRTTTEFEMGTNQSILRIRNKHRHIKKQIRTELHSISEFFSNCGGSLGLFLGVSIFSIVELLYFCTVRLYLHCKRGTADSDE